MAAAPKHAVAPALSAVEDELDGSNEAVTKEVFKPYVCQCSSIVSRKVVPHAGDIAEASSLSAIPLPPSDYPLFEAFPAAVVEQGKLSQLQLEGVLYACTRHQQILPSGERAGFFIGDGAGVGKGRQIAGVILDNYARGRRRHLWLSTSTDLHVDATRDVRDLGAHIPVINGCNSLDAGTRALGLDKDLREGVLFLTYSTLISAGKAGRSRLVQVLEWLVGGTNTSSSSKGEDAAAALAAAARNWDGVLVFDECHKAKNFAPDKQAQSTKVASAVIELQSLLPNARVLYCSATGVSEVGNMAYMARMGLWGPSSAFPDFSAFLESMRKRGVSFMELLAMEMKAAGRYVARGLSFRDAEFLQIEAPLSPVKVQQYDAAVQLWQDLRRQLEQALALSGSTNNGIWKTFWAAQQRFFKLLCIDLKLATVLAEAKAALASGMCVVIGLQSTGEAAADAMGLEPGPLPGFVSPCKELLVRFLNQHFPVLKAQSAEAAAAGLPQEAIPACRQMKQALLARVAALQLPANFLDVLIDELGGPSKVAEMTGRKGRVVRQQRQGARPQVVYELRAKPDTAEMDSLNVSERDAFMSGKKLVALISDAASTGISLHAVATAVNKARRLHLTVELPWSADKAIQQFGRSHRTNQLTAPVYKLVVSGAGGERRFAAAVARRLQSLGALTRGDRRAAAGLDLSESNFDSPWGRKSLRKMYDHIVCESPQLPAGVAISALLKDLLPPITAAATGTAVQGNAADADAAGQEQQQVVPQQEQQEALRLLQADIPALALLQRLAAQEAAAAGVAAAAALRTAGPTAGSTSKSPASQQQQQQQPQQPGLAPSPPATAAGAGASRDEEAEIVAALTGKSLPGSQSSQPPMAPSAAARAAAGAAARPLMSAAQVSMSISELHHELRCCCDMMDIGLGSGPRQTDTVAEERPKDAGVSSSSKASKDLGDVRRFLNRLLGLPLGRQNLLFNYFAATLAAEIAAAKAEGRYSEGVSDLQGSSIWRAKPPQLLWGADGTAAPGSSSNSSGDASGDALGTWVDTLVVDRGVNYQDALKRLAHEAFPGCSSGFRRSRRPMFGTYVVLLALQKPGHKNAFSIVRPNTGESFLDMERSDLDAKYVQVTPEAAKDDWVAAYTRSLSSCMHGAACTNRGHCNVGTRLSEVTILSGAVVRIWGVLESILDRHANELPKSERAMRVVRVAFSATRPATATAEDTEQQQEQQQQDQQQQDLQQQEQQQQGQLQQDQQQEQQQLLPGAQAGQSSSQQQQACLSSPPRQQSSQQQQEQQADLTPQQQDPRQLPHQPGNSPTGDSPSKGSPRKGNTSAAEASLSLVGVRYPAHLLPEVVATLASLQDQVNASAAIAAAAAALRGQQTLPAALGTQQLLLGLSQAASQLQQQQQQQLKGPAMSGWWKAGLAKGAAAGTAAGAASQRQQSAAATGAMNDALGIARVEPPTPIDSKLLIKAYKAPKTIFSFYQSASAPIAATASQSAGKDAAPATQAPAHGSKASSSNSGPAASSGRKPTSSSASKSNPLLDCFSRMASKQPASQQQQQKRQLAQQQRAALPPAKRPKDSKQQQPLKNAESSSVIIIESDSEVTDAIGAPTADTAAWQQQQQQPRWKSNNARQARTAAVAARAKIAVVAAPDEAPGATEGSEEVGIDASMDDDCEQDCTPLPEALPGVQVGSADAHADAAQQHATAGGAGVVASVAAAEPFQQQEPSTAAALVATGGVVKPAHGQVVTPRKLQLLASMGFTGLKAERALWVSHGDVEGAIDFCLRG